MTSAFLTRTGTALRLHAAGTTPHRDGFWLDCGASSLDEEWVLVQCVTPTPPTTATLLDAIAAGHTPELTVTGHLQPVTHPTLGLRTGLVATGMQVAQHTAAPATAAPPTLPSLSRLALGATTMAPRPRARPLTEPGRGGNAPVTADDAPPPPHPHDSDTPFDLSAYAPEGASLAPEPQRPAPSLGGLSAPTPPRPRRAPRATQATAPTTTAHPPSRPAKLDRHGNPYPERTPEEWAAWRQKRQAGGSDATSRTPRLDRNGKPYPERTPEQWAEWRRQKAAREA